MCSLKCTLKLLYLLASTIGEISRRSKKDTLAKQLGEIPVKNKGTDFFKLQNILNIEEIGKVVQHSYTCKEATGHR